MYRVVGVVGIFFSMNLWVSEWVIVDLNANLIFLQLYHGENRLIFNEMMMRSTLY